MCNIGYLTSTDYIKVLLCVSVKAYVHKSVMQELKRIIEDSEIMEEDDALWPPPDRVGRQVGNTTFVSNQSTVLIIEYFKHFVNEL